MRSIRRTPAVLALCAAGLAAVPAAGQVLCAPGARASAAVVTVLDADFGYDRPLAVRVSRPYAAEQQAVPVPGQYVWRLPLPAPTAPGAVSLAPVRADRMAVSAAPPVAEVRGGECVVHFTYRLQPALRVEVGSSPDRIPVEVPGAAQRYTTDFTTGPIPLDGALQLRFQLADRHVLPLTIRARDLRNGREIRHGNEEIKRLLCGSTPRSNATLCTFRYRRVDTQEIHVRLVQP